MGWTLTEAARVEFTRERKRTDRPNRCDSAIDVVVVAGDAPPLLAPAQVAQQEYRPHNFCMIFAA